MDEIRTRDLNPDTISRDQLNQKLKLIVDDQGYVIYSNTYNTSTKKEEF